jgi:hypothetical protein
MPFAAEDLRAISTELWRLAWTTPAGCEHPFLNLSRRLEAAAENIEKGLTASG